MQFYPRQMPRLAGPMELVFLISVQKIVFESALLYGRLYGEGHHGDAHAQFAESGIESRLIEVKRLAISKPVLRGCGHIVQVNDQ